MVNHRLLKEYKEISKAKPDPEIQLALSDESDIFTWEARLRGPAGTPYENGIFELSIKCPSTYPLAPPKVSFVTPIFHPNVLFKTGAMHDACTPASSVRCHEMPNQNHGPISNVTCALYR